MSPNMYAYLRVSTNGQTTDNQRSKIGKVFAVDQWLVEHAVSGKIRALDRPVFNELADLVREGDTVIAVSLDRLGRDTEDVLHTIRIFHEKGVHLRLMDLDGVDLTSQTGKMMVTLLSMVAEMEREKCLERTAAAIERARDEKKVFGRYLTILPDTLQGIVKDRNQGVTFRGLAEKYKLDSNTICQTLKKWEGDLGGYAGTWEKQQAQKVAKEEKKLKKAA